jgi:hypothetical protein
MNDLPQNELLSAYLDGELTAAEQAEMERLLAESPAARQLVEELRAVGNTLRSLPQEKLPEDLSRQVLRIAERRMLKEEEPSMAGDGATPPVPLGRSLFRRFVNRRSMAWLTLIAAIWLAITINERRHGVRPLAEANKEVALVKDRKAENPAPFPSSRLVAREEAKLDEVSAVQEAAKPANAGESVALVHCNISPEAVEKRAFEKLLDANGIAWRQRTMPKPSAGGREKNAAGAAGPGQLLAERSVSWPSLAGGEENLVEIEATPAQLAAALAGLKAQPVLFRSFSVQPNIHALVYANKSFARGAESGRSPPPPGSPLAGAPLAAPMLKAERQAKPQLQPQSSAAPPARQRVLFVLHVIDSEQPPAAAKP